MMRVPTPSPEAVYGLRTILHAWRRNTLCPNCASVGVEPPCPTCQAEDWLAAVCAKAEAERVAEQADADPETCRYCDQPSDVLSPDDLCPSCVIDEIASAADRAAEAWRDAEYPFKDAHNP